MNFAKVLFSDLTIKESIKRSAMALFGYINRVKDLKIRGISMLCLHLMTSSKSKSV